jgi:inositol hexakisphosphate/diphosphoinositol-pentakisphosphate kinase
MFSPTPRTPISIPQVGDTTNPSATPSTTHIYPAHISPPPVSLTPAPTTPTPNKYSLRIGFSPGCTVNDPLDIQLDSKHCINVAPRRSLTSHLDVDIVKELLTKRFSRVELPKRFLPVSIRGEVGKSVASVPWSNVVSDEASETAGDVSGMESLEKKYSQMETLLGKK